jgi:polyhydroxyalkanoate synthesis regulator protein
VTLEEIAQIIREGNEIQVIDNKSKNDITYMTQIQLLFDQERKSTKQGNTELLKRVIRSDEGTLTGYIGNLESKLNLTFDMPVIAPMANEIPAFAAALNSSMENSATLN